MIGRLNHVAIAVRDIRKAAHVYRDTLGAEVSETVAQPDHGVTTVFITLPNTKIELLEPLGEGSPIAKVAEVSPWKPPSSVVTSTFTMSPGASTSSARGMP